MAGGLGWWLVAFANRGSGTLGVARSGDELLYLMSRALVWPVVGWDGGDRWDGQMDESCGFLFVSQRRVRVFSFGVFFMDFHCVDGFCKGTGIEGAASCLGFLLRCYFYARFTHNLYAIRAGELHLGSGPPKSEYSSCTRTARACNRGDNLDHHRRQLAPEGFVVGTAITRSSRPPWC